MDPTDDDDYNPTTNNTTGEEYDTTSTEMETIVDKLNCNDDNNVENDNFNDEIPKDEVDELSKDDDDGVDDGDGGDTIVNVAEDNAEDNIASDKVDIELVEENKEEVNVEIDKDNNMNGEKDRNEEEKSINIENKKEDAIQKVKDVKEDNEDNQDESMPLERAIAAVAAAAAAHSAQQGKSPSEEAALAKQTIQKNTTMIAQAQQQHKLTNASSPKDHVVNQETYELIYSTLKTDNDNDDDDKIRATFGEYNDSLLLLLFILANPTYSYSLASLHNKKKNNQNSNNAALQAANPQQPQQPTLEGEEHQQLSSASASASSSSESISKELIDATSVFHKHIKSTYASLLDRLPTPPDTETNDDLKNASALILDLLPSCFSSDDATNAFFTSCSNKTPTNITSQSTQAVNVAQNTKVMQHAPPAPPQPTPPSYAAATTIASVLSSKLGRMRSTANTLTSHTLTTNYNTTTTQQSDNTSNNAINNNDASSIHNDPNNNTSTIAEGQDYSIQISREMLGLTVENVLERTIVRTVLPNGAAKKAGAKIGSLIVQVGTVDTKYLTHFETIDELRQSQRPLKLVLRRISKKALAGAREEMGRLIRGGGYGCIWNQIENMTMTVAINNDNKINHTSTNNDNDELIVMLKYLKHIWIKNNKSSTTSTIPYHHSSSPDNNTDNVKKDQALIKAGEKLIWILLLLCYGLEHQANNTTTTTISSSYKESTNAIDAAKSVSKILVDYIIRIINTSNAPSTSSSNNTNDNFTPVISKKYQSTRKKQIQQQQQQQARKQQLQQQQENNSTTNNYLFQIGDILHRTQTFLADPYSKPAALLRGELIALLCDVLDLDTDMELAEIETATSSSSSTSKGNNKKTNSTTSGDSGGGGGGPITDLGSSGSLLKLIIRNCTVMQSQTCYTLKEDHFKHAGNRFLAVVHRLAASRSTSARVTACSLAPVLWSHLDFPHQLQLRGVITRALHDVEVIVRKSTAAVLHEIAELVFDSRAVPWLVLMCERAMTDPDPQLRAAAMTLTWHLAEHLPNAFLGDASKGSRSLSRLPSRSDPMFAEVYLLQCKLLPVATRLGEDRAPSVRLAVAAQCDRLCTALGGHWFIVIIDLLQALLADSDDRVRSEAILCMPRLVESVLLGTNFQDSEQGIGVLEALLPVAIKLLKDSSTLVRVSLATSCGELLTFLVALGRGTSAPTSTENSDQIDDDVDNYKRHKKHVDETLIPLVQRLLHDSDPEVTSAALRAVTNASRGNVKKISSRRTHMNHHSEDDGSAYLSDEDSVEIAEPVFLPVLSEKQVLRLLPTLSDLATSPQWRVRQSAVEIVPALLGCTELLETRTKIAKLCITLMHDSVDAVRKTAAECLCLGGSSLASGALSSSSSSLSLSDSQHSSSFCGKSEWISAIVLPHLTETCNSTNCKQRILCLKMVEVILCNHSTTSSSVLRQLLDIALSLSEDPIANVRLNVGRVLAHVMHTLDQENVIYTRERLEQMLIQEKDRNNCDRDVLYFVQKAISKRK